MRKPMEKPMEKPMRKYKFFKIENIENNEKYSSRNCRNSKYTVINADSYAEACEELVAKIGYHVVTEGDGDEN